jgi:hypothetical protein
MIQNREGYTGKRIQMQEYAPLPPKKARMAILEICTVKNDSFHGK